MKSLMRSVDKFCYRHPKFGITNLMLFIIIGNVIVFLLSTMDRSLDNAMINALCLSPYHILRGEVWRLITFIFVPANTDLLFLVITLYFYYFIGSTLERQWGSGKFTIYYFTGVLLTIVAAFAAYLMGYDLFIGGAQYLNLSMFFAFATLFPEQRVLLLFIIPVKIKWLAYLDAIFFLYTIITMPFPLMFIPIIAILNYLLFCGYMLLQGIKGIRGGFTKQRSDFQRNRHQAIYEVENVNVRKCSVCGRTEKDYPELEFRYCSRCEGYHCFCIDHIDSHIHFTE